MPERKIATGPGHPEITKKMETGAERMAWKFPENFAGFGEDILPAPAPTPVAPYPDTLINRFSNWFSGSSILVKLGIAGVLIAGLVHLEKKWR